MDLRRNRLELMLKVLDVDGAVRRVKGGWVATGQQWEYDRERYARVAAQRTAEQQIMREYETTPGCRMRFLREQLDDPYAEGCGRCDRCAQPWYPTDVPDAALGLVARSARGSFRDAPLGGPARGVRRRRVRGPPGRH